MGYVLPGERSTEYRTTVRAALAGGAFALAGVAVSVWLGHPVGHVMVGAGALVVAATVASYSHGRSRVKAGLASAPPEVRSRGL